MNYVFKKQLERLVYMLIPSAGKRSRRLKKKGYFAQMGENVHFQPRKLPADPKYIKLHNNIKVASDVTFITHDIIHSMFNDMENKECDVTFKSHLGCIEVMDNVFIGSGTIIMPDVRIGPNAIVAAGSVVTKDVPVGSVVAGIPAKVIGTFDDAMQKRAIESEAVVDNGTCDREKRAELEWEKFYLKRNDR